MTDTLLPPADAAAPTFAELGVPEFVCRALERRGITHPFEIQAATIADALAGRDVSGAAPTGSGKTLAFGVPLIAMTRKGRPHHPKALVLSPTRELADQITDELSTLSDRSRVAAVYGGVGYGKQMSALKSGVDVLVACPGRLEDLMESGAVRLSEVERVVIDEADRMADMGFLPAVRRILDKTTSRSQTVLFSATLDGDVGALVREYQNDPVRHEVTVDEADTVPADHVFWTVKREERNALLARTLSDVWPAVVFCKTRHGAERLAKQLDQAGVSTVSIHGGRSQQQRTKALADFTKGRVQAMIATDVAARGIHVDDVAVVVHYDVPEDHKAYVHRSGRTARAGRNGLVISLIEPNGHRAARRMQREAGVDSPITEPDLEAIADHRSTVPAPERRPFEPAAPRQEEGRKAGGPAGSRRQNARAAGRPRQGDPRQGNQRQGEQRQGERRQDGAREGFTGRSTYGGTRRPTRGSGGASRNS
jgi:superfamily II DNA/RNA helicase